MEKKFEHKENTGSIFKNNRKEKDTHPDYKGQINVNGKLLDIALWVKEGSKGSFFSAKVSEPFTKEQKDSMYSAEHSKKVETDDLPF